MAFLDNSGDIILDAVLTDTGRMRLAKGDGSFRVAKFALGDDEIDYSLYNSNNSSGSAYFDLEILQTPVLEAFTNNASSMKSKLISIARNNLLYLPVMKINKNLAPTVKATSLINEGYILAADTDTEEYLATQPSYNAQSLGGPLEGGILFGKDAKSGASIRIDQGIDNEQILTLDPDLLETQYLVEIDNRFASLVAPNVDTSQNAVNNNLVSAIPSYIDDDNIATYYFSRGVDNLFVFDGANSTDNTLAGAKGTYLTFKLSSQNEVSTNDFLFDQIGSDVTAGWSSTSATLGNMKSILTNIRITGVNTGNSVDIPLLILKARYT